MELKKGITGASAKKETRKRCSCATVRKNGMKFIMLRDPRCSVHGVEKAR